MLGTTRALALCLLTCSCAATDLTASPQATTPAPVATPAAAQGAPTAASKDPSKDAPLTIERVLELSRELRPRAGELRGWTPDGKGYLWVETPRPAPRSEATPGPSVPARTAEEGARIAVVDVESGQRRPLFDAARMEKAFAALPGIDEATARRWSRRTTYDLTAAHDGVLINDLNDLFFCRFGAERAVRLTTGPEEEVGETLSPDGKLVAYIHDWNLWVASTDGGAPRPLTVDGDENHLYGRLDWVYQEEIYGRGNFGGFWWSPDSRRIAFLILDESPVPTYTVVDHRKVQPEVEEWRYPKAGQPNPKVRLAVVDVAGGAMRSFDLAAYAPEEFLIVRVGWRPDGERVIFQVQDRIQTWLDVCSGDPGSGKVERLFRDATAVWIEPTDAPHWLADGKQFLWLSERDGFRHLYHYGLDGKLVRRLTEGPWEVDTVHAVDEQAGVVYADIDKDDVRGSQLYAVKLDGSGAAALTKEPGTHRISLAPDFRHFISTFSSVAHPGRVELARIDGTRVRLLDEADGEAVAKAGLLTPEFVQVKTQDGFALEGMLLKPAGFQAGQRYPVLCFIYGGPHAPQVRNVWASFNMLYHQMLAREGYLIWIVDNRSASGKGLASVAGVYKNLGQQELADLEESLDWLVARGLADPDRIGIWGWSYGGYMSAYALTHSKRFKVGIAGAPVTDWRLYDSIYTERYMDLPQRNPEGYKRSSVIEAAKDLSGKLLVIHGTIDENVHMQNTLQLAEALQKAGKSFQLMLYPGNRHGVVQPDQRKHLYATMADFIRTNL